MQLAVKRRLRRLLALGALLVPLGGCISELVVEVQPMRPPPGDGSDGGVIDEEDASVDPAPPDSGPLPPLDAEVVGIAPAEDARVQDGAGPEPKLDGGTPDAASDAGPIIVLEAGADAGCKGTQCDAGAPPGPCPGGCDIATLVTPECDAGGRQLCWSNPDGTCSVQCPAVRRCSAKQPCAEDEWCYFEDDSCGDTLALGYCAKRRASCGDSNFGVCGCDGMRYDNPCLANQAGFAVREGAVCR